MMESMVAGLRYENLPGPIVHISESALTSFEMRLRASAQTMRAKYMDVPEKRTPLLERNTDHSEAAELLRHAQMSDAGTVLGEQQGSTPSISFQKMSSRGKRGMAVRRVKAIETDTEFAMQELERTKERARKAGLGVLKPLGPQHFVRGVHALPSEELHMRVGYAESDHIPVMPSATTTVQTMPIDEAIAQQRAQAQVTAQAIAQQHTNAAAPPPKSTSNVPVTSSELQNGITRFMEGANVALIEVSSRANDIVLQQGSLVAVRRDPANAHPDGASPAGYNVPTPRAAPLSTQVAYERTYETQQESNAHDLEELRALMRESHDRTSKQANLDDPDNAYDTEQEDSAIRQYLHLHEAHLRPKEYDYMAALLSRQAQGLLPPDAALASLRLFESAIPVSREVERMYLREPMSGEQSCSAGCMCRGLHLNIDRPFVLREADFMPVALDMGVTCVDVESLKRVLEERANMTMQQIKQYEPQLCILCLHWDACESYIAVAASNTSLADTKTDEHGRVVHVTQHLLCNFYNLTDRVGEYCSGDCVLPSSQRWLGLPGPVVAFGIDSFYKRVQKLDGIPVQCLEFKGDTPRVDGAVNF